jgi:CheY-like chemotaxis protein
VSSATDRLVLVVDDHPETRELYGTTLRYAGFQVIEAGDGAEGSEKAAALQPDVILLDYAMPQMDGGEMVRRLAANERTRDIPVVLLSAFADRVPRQLRLGCAAFLAKPCDPDDLSRLLELVVVARPRAR